MPKLLLIRIACFFFNHMTAKGQCPWETCLPNICSNAGGDCIVKVNTVTDHNYTTWLLINGILETNFHPIAKISKVESVGVSFGVQLFMTLESRPKSIEAQINLTIYRLTAQQIHPPSYNLDCRPFSQQLF